MNARIFVRRVVLIAAVTGVVAVFQNCGREPTRGNGNGEGYGGGETAMEVLRLVCRSQSPSTYPGEVSEIVVRGTSPSFTISITVNSYSSAGSVPVVVGKKEKLASVYVTGSSAGESFVNEASDPDVFSVAVAADLSAQFSFSLDSVPALSRSGSASCFSY